MNRDGFTLENWRRAAADDLDKIVSDDVLDAWRACEDPCEYRRVKEVSPILPNDDFLN